MRRFICFVFLSLPLFSAILLDDQVMDLAGRIRRLAEKETQVTRADTLRRLERLLAGETDAPVDPGRGPAEAAALLDRLEHGKDDPAGYAELAAMVTRYDISTGTDNPSVRARIALAELAALLRTDYDAALPALRALRGRPVVVSFWATWCAPCQTEMPVLEKLHREGVAVVAVSDEAAETVDSFVKRGGLTLPVVRDPERKVFTKFGVTAMPAIRILDGRGRLRVEAGEVDEAELRRLVALGGDR